MLGLLSVRGAKSIGVNPNAWPIERQGRGVNRGKP